MIFYFLVAFSTFLSGLLVIMLFFPKIFRRCFASTHDLSRILDLAMEHYGGGLVLPIYYIIPETGVMHQVLIPIRGIDDLL